MSIVKIAKSAGVSHTTVSRVINNERNVAPETVVKVRNAMKKLGYTPKPPSMRRGPRRAEEAEFKTGNIAFLVCSRSLSRVMQHSPVLSDVIHGVEEALGKHGMTMIQGSIGSDRPLPPLVSRGEVDGIIVWPNLDEATEEVVEMLRPYHVVYVMSSTEMRLPGDRIRNNNASIGRIAADRLIQHGHKVLAYITPSSLASTINLGDRWAGFQAKATAKDCEARQLIIEQSHLDMLELDRDQDMRIKEALEGLFNESSPPTGLFITCDALTAKAYPILKQLGKRPGKDVEVISCNNEISLLAGLDPRPESIDIRAELIGQRAVEQLRRRIIQPDEGYMVTLEVEPAPL